MKYRWIVRVLALALLMASVVGFAGVAEGFGQTPSTSVTLGMGETCQFDTSAILVTDDLAQIAEREGIAVGEIKY